MAWLSEAAANGTIDTVKYITERLASYNGTWRYYKKLRTITQTDYIGLTETAAEAAALAASAETDCTDAHTEAMGGGAYKAVTVFDVTEDRWQTDDPPASPLPPEAAGVAVGARLTLPPIVEVAPPGAAPRGRFPPRSQWRPPGYNKTPDGSYDKKG